MSASKDNSNCEKKPDDPIRYYDFSNNRRPDIQNYIECRFKDQLKWYEDHSNSSRIKYYVCQILIVFFGATIPIINVLAPDADDDYLLRLSSSFFGGAIIVATGLLQLTKAYENWVNYRSTAEQLKQEYNLFALKAEDYSDEKSKDKLFVEKVEAIVRSEGKKYLAIHQYPQPKATES